MSCNCVEPCKKQGSLSRDYTCSCSCKLNCRSTIRVNFRQTENLYWCFDDAVHWEFMGSSENVGDMLYINEYSVYGCSLTLVDQLRTMVSYFTELNAEGLGRYCLRVQVCNDEDMYEYEWRVVYEDFIIINNNRILDSIVDINAKNTKRLTVDVSQTTTNIEEKINTLKKFTDEMLISRSN